MEGDTVAINLPFYLKLSPSCYVKWIKEPRPMTLLDSKAVIVSNSTEGIKFDISMYASIAGEVWFPQSHFGWDSP